MRANEVFSWLGAERTRRLLEELSEKSPTAASLAVGAASEAFHLRPQFLRRQPIEKRADWVRRALARPASAATAEQVLADYFLELHRPLLVELLDALGVAHEDGELSDPAPAPPETAKLQKAVKRFLKGKDAERRELLVRAFAAQSAVDWPGLDEMLSQG